VDWILFIVANNITMSIVVMFILLFILMNIAFCYLTSVSCLKVNRSIARSASRRYLIYPETDFEVFRPQGRHVSPMGWNLAWRRSPPPCQILPPIGATTRVQDPTTEIFTQIWPECGILTPRTGVSLARFHKICRICTPFHDALAVKIWLDLL